VPSRVFILIFHGVGDPPRPLEPGEEKAWVSRRNLRSILDAAAGRPDVRLTFDDGNSSDHDRVLPELVDRGLRATFFVVADRIGGRDFLSPAAIRDLIAAGMSVQSHGTRHRVWRGLDRHSLERDLKASRARIEDVTGKPVNEVAIPYCLYDRRVLRAVRDTGYRRVYTCDGGSARVDSWLQARNQISAGEDARKLEEIVSPSLPVRLEIAIKTPIKRWR
jgi:peptidoglycan/xylan/chitin deacetylase (PgdA/CDA1 family)